MTDRPASSTDRASEQQGQKGLNVLAAGLNPCCTAFNDDYKEAMTLRLGKAVGQDTKPELARETEERLAKNGYKAEDIASDPKRHEGVTEKAQQQAKDDIIQAEESQNT